jgi:hypothetical protein
LAAIYRFLVGEVGNPRDGAKFLIFGGEKEAKFPPIWHFLAKKAQFGTFW